MAQDIGPVQLLAVGFDPDARFEGRIMDELANLRAPRDDPHPGSSVRGKGRRDGRPPCPRLPGRRAREPRRRASLASISRESSHLICRRSRPRLRSLADGDTGHCSLSQARQLGRVPAHRACRARDLKRTIRETGGFPLGEGFLTPETLAEVATELLAMSEALGTRGRGGWRRGVGRIKHVGPTERKEA